MIVQHTQNFERVNTVNIFIYDDYPEILRYILSMNAHDKYDVKKVAQCTYDTFLLDVANAFKETNIKRPDERRRALQVLQYFIKAFRDKIDTPELEIKDLAMRIRGYGVFVNIGEKFLGLLERLT
ncbi:unnamed protein product [Rotaria sp. Silwood2]|nr:unnamed protein product [Rotaria sp. Silwood2]